MLGFDDALDQLGKCAVGPFRVEHEVADGTHVIGHVSHAHAKARRGDHLAVIGGVPEGDRVRDVYAENLGKLPEALALVAA